MNKCSLKTTMCLFTETNFMASPLLLAIKNGEANTAKSILLNGQYSELDRQSPRKDGSALFFACSKGMPEMAHLLILHGANIESRTSYGATSLHAAVDHNHLEITRLLLGYGADVNAQTKRGDTACHFAAYRGFTSLVQTLAEAGADVTLENNKSQSPTRLAASRDHHAIVKYLQAVADLAKFKPRRSSERESEPSSLYHRTMSDESLSGCQREGTSFTRMNITLDMDRAESRALGYNSVDSDSTEAKICNSVRSNPEKPSLTLARNICGSRLTQVLKKKQYSKDFSWQD